MPNEKHRQLNEMKVNAQNATSISKITEEAESIKNCFIMFHKELTS